MKIFFVTSKLKNPNTAAGSVIELDYMMKELMRLGNEVTAVTVFSKTNDLTEPPPYKLIEENINSVKLFPIQWAIFKILRKYEKDCDIFHIDGQYIYGGGFYKFFGGKKPLFAYLIREPAILGEYTSFLFDNRSWREKYSLKSFWKLFKRKVRWFIERFILVRLASKIDYVSCLNPILNKMHYDFGLRPTANGLIIGDTYPMDETMRMAGITENYYRGRAGKNEKVVLYYSGRMAPGKGYDLLLAGFARVKNKGNFKLILGGSGPEEPQVRRMIKDFGLENYVELPGWVSREKLYEYLKTSDIYVFTRWGKALSALALVEATVFGLPSIVPARTGLAWEAGKSALTFEPENPEDLARQIEKLGSDSELRKELSRQCYERLKEPDLDSHQTVVAMNVIMKSLVFGPKKQSLYEFLNGLRKLH
ncbi:hypothetical protein A3G55_00495 [Candidatus Giovannonibacteria bacterium RIFCSPLOWO2_12_FULL_44_25]|uniref:Glycosyl transferase family 1 domain-containing protein n=3 Tax=Parcubacteria group TaxID=1794811 RepID=A0A837IKR7_9BACT|nr:MAG: hypothetical protein UW15_C0022G0013 [Parcubacteria group bacterium GW2011_GWC1_44_10]KKT60413.1 MAG: hypothetical protein UW53_C0001G0063 [Candidatus Giovannonibacteria bacterium GW2011_GWA1_44_25]KKU12189.1 MAG: hypothetical protein UX18_C0028G0002 [Candidatus Azambacteria bacterium GW2011_GWC2_45_7b]KKU30271.1 MAG: hypothetical protein UX43_C0001G0043 [Candidatus Giovannonibacteria bacterium GW2011_GWB1_46_20]OGF50478.1 MAG: hypothetical protein A2120_02430 [Candidatus Giovannonibact